MTTTMRVPKNPKQISVPAGRLCSQSLATSESLWQTEWRLFFLGHFPLPAHRSINLFADLNSIRVAKNKRSNSTPGILMIEREIASTPLAARTVQSRDLDDGDVAIRDE
jgi:hypothetical protein